MLQILLRMIEIFTLRVKVESESSKNFVESESSYDLVESSQSRMTNTVESLVASSS